MLCQTVQSSEVTSHWPIMYHSFLLKCKKPSILWCFPISITITIPLNPIDNIIYYNPFIPMKIPMFDETVVMLSSLSMSMALRLSGWRLHHHFADSRPVGKLSMGILSLGALFHGKSKTKMDDDVGYPHDLPILRFQKGSYPPVNWHSYVGLIDLAHS